MCIIDQTISTSVYISQIEQHIQMLQHLLQGLKYADRMEQRARNHPFMSPYPNTPDRGFGQSGYNRWTQQQPKQFSVFGGTSNTATLGEAFKFFNHNLIITQWVVGMSPCIGGNFEFKVQSAVGINFVEMTIDELARKTANNGVLNHLINLVTTSPKGVNVSAWRVDGGRMVITIDNLGSFVCDENILPILRLTRPILDLRTKPTPIPDTTPPTANFLITRVLGRHSNVGDFEIEGYVSNGHPHKLSQTVISIIDLPMYISYPNGLQPTKEHPRTAWILSPNVVLTLLDIDGVLMNEVIKLKDLGEYPNTTVMKDFCEGVENIDPVPVGGKVAEEDLCEVEITHFSNIRQDLTKWLASPWSIDSVESIDGDGITGVGFNLLSIDTSNRHKLEITNNYLTKWFDLRSDYLSNGWTLSKIVREMSDNLNIIATIVSFEEHNGVIVQVLRPDNTVTLYTTDLKRGKSFIEATKDLNSRWINVVTVD